MKNVGKGSMQISLQMKNFIKKYFDSYSDAEIWMLNTSEENEGKIRKEGGRYYIFVEDSQKLHSL